MRGGRRAFIPSAEQGRPRHLRRTRGALPVNLPPAAAECQPFVSPAAGLRDLEGAVQRGASGLPASSRHCQEGRRRVARAALRPTTREATARPRTVAQIGNLPCRRLAVGGASAAWSGLRITNPRYSRLEACATDHLARVTAGCQPALRVGWQRSAGMAAQTCLERGASLRTKVLRPTGGAMLRAPDAEAGGSEHRSADWQSAVSRVGGRWPEAAAECQPFVSPAAGLRDLEGAVQRGASGLPASSRHCQEGRRRVARAALRPTLRGGTGWNGCGIFCVTRGADLID
jgi:hypothetical protein